MPKVPLDRPRLIDQQKRVALPPEVLRALDVGSGDYVLFRLKGREVHVLKAKWTVGPS